MRWARVALYSFLGVFALLALAVVLLLTVDLGRLKGTTENLLSNVLNREFAIGGQFSVDFGRHIHVIADDVTLAGTEWSANDNIASVGHIEATVDTWSLLDWPILIESLRVDNARVYLERNEAQENNWTFLEPQEDVETPQADPEKKPRLPVMLVDAAVTDFRLTYDSPERPRPFEFSATEIKAVQTGEEDLRLTLHGDINQTPVGLTMSAGPVNKLVDFYDVDFDWSGNLGEIRLEGRAEFGNLIRPRRPTISLNVQGPNAEYLTGILRLRQITTGPLDLTASIAPVGEKMQLLVNGNFGEFSLDTTGRFVNLQELKDVDLRVAASGPDASTVAKLFGNDKVPEDPFSIVGTFERSGKAISVEEIKVAVGKTQFQIGGHFDNFPDPRGATATIRINGPDFGRFGKLLGLPGRLHGEFRLDADLTPLAEGGATVDLKAVTQDVEFNMVGNVTADPDFVGTRVEASYGGPNFRVVGTAAGLTDAPAEPFNLHLLIDRVSNGVAVETATVTIGDDRLTFRGLVGNKPLQADTDIEFELAGPDLAGVLAAFGRDADKLPYTRYKAGGRIERGAEHFTLHDVKAAIGDDLDYELTVDGQLNIDHGLAGSKVRVRAAGASLGALTDAAGIEGLPDLAFQVGATVERVGNGYSVEGGDIRVGDDRITVSGLVGDRPLERDTDIRFDARLPDLQASLQHFGIQVGAVPAAEFAATGRIQHRGSHFAVQNLTASLAGAHVEVDGRLGALPALDGTDLKIQVEGMDLSSLLPDEEKFSVLDKAYGLSASVRMRDERLALDDLELTLGKMRLAAALDFDLAPLLGSGNFSIDASSPDLYELLPKLEEVGVSETAPMELKTAGDWADHIWTIDNFFLQLGKGNMTTSGVFDGPPDFDRTDLKFDWNISSMRNFSVLAGRELPEDTAHLNFHLTGTDERISIEEFTGAIGDSDISGDFSLQSGDVPEIRVGLRSDRIDLSSYLPDPQSQDAAEAEPPQAASKKDRLIPDTVIPMDELRKVQVTVDIRIAELIARQHTMSNIVLLGAIDDGALLVQDFNLKGATGGELSGEFEVRPADNGADVLLAIRGSQLGLGLPAESEEELATLPKYDLETVLHGSGATVRELAGSLDGYVRLIGGEGRMKATALRFFTGDFTSEVLNTINPFSKSDPYTNFECAVVLLLIEDGNISGKPAVVSQSDRLRIFANANIDLKSEKLSADINTVPQKGLGLSFSDLVNPFTKVGGTLAKPTLAVDAEGALIEGGAAVATVGLSIVVKRFKDRFLSEKDACGKAVSDSDADFQAVRLRFYPESEAAQ